MPSNAIGMSVWWISASTLCSVISPMRTVSSNPEQLSGRGNQRTERIRVEDGGSRVDELRVGGQTQSINVQPKGSDMPAYEVKSPDGARSRSGSNSGAETNTAPRVWNVMKF